MHFVPTESCELTVKFIFLKKKAKSVLCVTNYQGVLCYFCSRKMFVQFCVFLTCVHACRRSNGSVPVVRETTCCVFTAVVLYNAFVHVVWLSCLGRPFLSHGIEFVACLPVEPMRLWWPHTVSENNCNSDLSPGEPLFVTTCWNVKMTRAFFSFFLFTCASQCAITPCGPYGVLNGFCGAKRCSSLVWPADHFLFTNVKGAFLVYCTTAWGGGDLSFFSFFFFLKFNSVKKM